MALTTTRRAWISSGLIALAAPVNALDMEAFENSLLDTPRSISNDEALCKFGAPSPARGQACERVGLSTTGSKVKVDAYGNIDRGNFARCQREWKMVNGKYEKFDICQ